MKISLEGACSALVVAWLISSSSAVSAQVRGDVSSGAPSAASGNASAGFDDIIVTAQKRSESINDVPLAIIAVGGAELAARGVTDTAQLTKIVPSFSVLQSAYGQPVFFIRGIGFDDPNVSFSPTVSVYLDEAPLPYTAMTRGAALDLERVEVLKGPQGTLFGQNSTGGAVNYIAAKPTAALTAGLDLEAGRFDYINATAFVSGPISSTLGFRVAVQNRYQDDWQRSQTRNDERGQKRFYNARATLDWSPTERLRFSLTASGWQDKSDTQAPQLVVFAPARVGPDANQAAVEAFSRAAPAPRNTRIADWDPGARTARDDNFYQFTLRGDYEIGETTLTSISSYSKAKIDYPTDFDGTDFNNSFIVLTAGLKTFSQELRLAGELGDRIRWLVGGNYQYADTRERVDQTFNATNNSVGPFMYDLIKINSNQKVKTYAGFGNLEFNLTDTVTARASGRYTTERRRFNGCLADPGNGRFAQTFGFLSMILSGQPVTIAPGACTTFSNTTFQPVGLVRDSLAQDNFSWRVGLDWEPSASTLVYGNAAKGYKSGGFTSLPAVFVSQLAPVSQESVMAYELGVKKGLFDRRFQINAAAFYYDYKDKQLQGYIDIPPFGPIATLVNLPKARVYGAEVEIVARPSNLLTLRLSGAYLNTKAQSAPAVAISPLGGRYDFTGERFPNVPKYSATADIEQRFPVSPGTELYVGGSAQYRSSASAAFGATENAATRSLFVIDPYTLYDVRAGVALSDPNLTFELWGRNVTDKYTVGGVIRVVDAVIRFAGMPATYGARLRWRY